MQQENFEKVMRLFLRTRPFHAFTIELIGGGRVEVNHPEALQLYPEGLIVCLSTTKTRSVFEVGSVVRFLTITGTT